jgi:hydroxymethylpyrimidine/phosphomethylpyrimidine kinase
MLASPSIVRAVSEAVSDYKLRLVVDPVMLAKSGAPLLKREAISSLKELLLPLAEVVTPNIDEAESLSGMKIDKASDMEAAGKAILDLGPKAVVIKGGHLDGEPIEVLLTQKGLFKQFRGTRISSGATHGTGCTFSAAITAFLSKGIPLEESVSNAKSFVTNAILYGLNLGKGIGPANPISNLEIDAERYRVTSMMSDALSILESTEGLSLLCPECQINIGMALPFQYAREQFDVCAIPGRIVKAGSRLKATSCPSFGGSRHVAKVILAAMSYDPRTRSAMNILYSEEILNACVNLGFLISSYDRALEPDDVKLTEGASIPWGISEAIKSAKRVPDIIFHRGDMGKEPMLNILGRDAVEVVMKARAIAGMISKQ